jgi:type I restriction enzyme S subunit
MTRRQAGFGRDHIWRLVVTHMDGLRGKVDRLNALQEKTAAELDALLPSILDKTFKGEL